MRGEHDTPETGGDPEVLILSDRPDARGPLREALASLGAVAVDVRAEPDRLASPHLRLLVVDPAGEGGMDALRRAAEARPDVPVLAVSYPRTPREVEEATRLGVVRFLQGAASPAELREVAAAESDVEARRAERYEARIERAKASLRARRMAAAEAHARRALAIDPDRPDAYNLIGVARESTSRRSEALRFYRIALELDPTHELARRNAATASKPPLQRGPAEFE